MYRYLYRARAARKAVHALAIVALVVSQTATGWAGRGFFRNGAVGGISIDAAGVVRQPEVKARGLLLKDLRKEIHHPVAGLDRPVKHRVISLRGLHDRITESGVDKVAELPDEVRFLGGLQRIEYVIVDQDNNDILLDGPGEGWRVGENAVVVGVTTGRPMMRLDDLLVAFRTVKPARDEGITVSIDPTEEGYRNYAKLMQSLKRNPRVLRNPRIAEPQIKKAFGPQEIKITGVGTSTHFARVMTAADYRMKRYAMGLERAPIKGLPSYLQLAKAGISKRANVNPRWWLTTNYAPLARSEDGLAWHLRGPGVKCMTEDDVVDDAGKVKATGRKNKQAQRWADLFTKNYDRLSERDPVFGELRNLMDMCVIAALIEKHHLFAKAGFSAPRITEANSTLQVEAWNAPKTVDPQCSFLRASNGNWIISASGGIEISSWAAASKSEMSTGMQDLRKKALGKGGQAWWNNLGDS